MTLRIKTLPSTEHPLISVVIAARNEALHIEDCLRSLCKQDYPKDKLEIIVVDDHSADQTFQIVENYASTSEYTIRSLKMSDPEAGSKKAALTYGIKNASAQWIAVTDADCIPEKKWLQAMTSAISVPGIKFVAGPVSYTYSENSFLEKIQSLEFMGLVGIAAAGITQKQVLMCNGANMLFSKQSFIEVNGFSDSSGRASGDDTQLLLKLYDQNRSSLMFQSAETAWVRTAAIQDKADLWEQRKRWAGKIPFTLSPFTIMIAVIAWFAHALLLFSTISLIWNPLNLPWLLGAWFIKLLCEFTLLKMLATYFREGRLLWLFLPAQLIYPLYVIVIGALAPFTAFRWKGRVVR